MARRLTALLRILYGTAGLLVLLAGLPLLLAAAVGWPLPRAVPTWEEVRSALGGSSVSDATILKIAAVVGWLAWAQLVASAAVEASAWARGRAPLHVPLSGPFQPVVRHLLITALLVGGAVRSAAPGPPASAVLAAAEQPAPTDCPPAPTPSPAGDAAAPTSPAAPAPAPTYTVKPRDSLWRIAEHALGDGFRWRELYELNRGVPQPDGRFLQDPNLIRPGWVLRLPADANPAMPAASDPVTEPAPVPPPAPESVPSQADGPAATSTTTTVTPTTVAADIGTTGDPVGSGATPRATDDEGAGGDWLPSAVGVGGAGLLAAGLVATVARLRRAQVRLRRPGRNVPIAGEAAAAADRRMRAVADLPRAERLGLAMHALAARLGGSLGPDAVPAIDAVLVGDDVEILFDRPVTCDPAPFRVEAGGRAWTLPGSADQGRLEVLARDAVPLAPALVAVGRTDQRDLLIDVERVPVTAVTGERDGVASLVWSITAGLATSLWCDDVRVIVVGGPADGFDGLERVEVVTADGAVDRLAPEVAATRGELESAGCRSTLAARLRGGSWTPIVAVVRAGARDDVVEELALLARGGAGFALVVEGDRADADRRAVARGGAVTVTPPGVTAASLDLDEAFREACGDLVQTSLPERAADGEELIDLTAPAAVVPSQAVVEDAGLLPDGAVLARVLGPVELDGARPVDRRQSEELVVYLALHPSGVDEQALKTALWPDSLPSTHTFNQVVSRARICLGTAPDGSHYLPRLEDGRYRLNQWVTTDVDRLESALRAARANPSVDSIDALARTLGLVRGQPFQGVKVGYEWAHSEGLATRFEIMAADAAHLVAEWHLDHEEATPALWAAGQGLLAAPLDEALYRDRMRAYAMSGNVSAVETVMRELCRAVDAVEPYDSLHPETLELYESLTRRRVG